MTITDPRQPVYIKKDKRYIAFGSLDDFGRFDSWHSEGLWLHTRGDHSKSQTKIADLTDLPCPAVQFASVLSKHQELVDLMREKRLQSTNDLAASILEWIATQSTKKTND